MIRSDHPTAAVIYPTLDESASIGDAVARCGDADEVIVADGGSSDKTAEIARDAGARVVTAERRGRAWQLNAGAAASSSQVLVFMHADTELPIDWRRHVGDVLARPGVIAGAFRFAVRGERPRERLITAVGHARASITGHPYGDQGLFLTRRTFEQIGGYPEQPIMEDWELVRRLRSVGRVAYADATAYTSTRQWDDGGLIRSTLTYLAIIGAYRAGVPADRLADWRRAGVAGRWRASG